MMRKTFLSYGHVALAVIIVLICAASSPAKEAVSTQVTTQEGVQLVQQFWTDMKNKDMAAIDKLIAVGFQSGHDDGIVRNRAQEISLIKGLHMGNYKLENFKVSQEGPVLIITYTVQVSETIDNDRLNSSPALRMTIFLKTEKGWKLIAHNNFKAIK